MKAPIKPSDSLSPWRHAEVFELAEK